MIVNQVAFWGVTNGEVFVILSMLGVGVYLISPQSEWRIAFVVKVIDVDTIEVYLPGGMWGKVRDGFEWTDHISVRLPHVDGDEVSETFGKEAKQIMIDRLAGEYVWFRFQKYDKFMRSVAEIEHGGIDISTWTIKNGIAKWFKRYSNRPDLKMLETKARLAGLGRWAKKFYGERKKAT
jgi:endonuclease YncB( thermonuclease family)